MDKESRIKMISEAISKVASADIGSFCNILEKKTNRMVAVENPGEAGKVLITLQGELEEGEIEKIAEIIRSVGGDEMQLSATLESGNAAEVVDRILMALAGTEDFDIEVELAVE